ncbi:MAG: hypothetical protein HN353_06325 [Bdellovibrionales bacterium]|jgi:hypothetical protein|nr:hypothetical protein [Bdellovibrionales bacterium]MBT3526249.1 hypothetical protein [Bdellovibrionales bacterium]MBT7668508.1 hypothetical protein [Bdellovibrionales bacterium]MBT7766685.1 hypothetical protein [Bdellovibrionales bacterium]
MDKNDLFHNQTNQYIDLYRRIGVEDLDSYLEQLEQLIAKDRSISNEAKAELQGKMQYLIDLSRDSDIQ